MKFFKKLGIVLSVVLVVATLAYAGYWQYRYNALMKAEANETTTSEFDVRVQQKTQSEEAQVLLTNWAKNEVSKEIQAEQAALQEELRAEAVGLEL